MQLTGAQKEQLLTCRRALLAEVGALITEWDGLWRDLEVGSQWLHCTHSADSSTAVPKSSLFGDESSIRVQSSS